MTERGVVAGIEIERLSRNYGSFVALQPTSLQIAASQFITLLGPSGSGKTTLLSIVAGLLEPTTGTVRIGGHDVTSQPPYARDIGMVFQGYALFPHMTVFENVAFPLRMRRIADDQMQKRVSEALAMVQLDHFFERMPSQLSGGQQQRVALARSLVHRPSVILMDEPLSSLDKKLREQMQLEIRQIHRTIKSTILYVTHDQQEAMTMSDRICVLNGGRIEQDGPPELIYFEPKNRFVAEFLGESNILRGNLIGAEGGVLRIHLPSGESVMIQKPASGVKNAEIEFMVRPERLNILDDTQDSTNTIECRLVERVFTGEVTRILLKTTWGQDLTATWLTDRAARPLAELGSVRVGWNVRDAVGLEA